MNAISDAKQLDLLAALPHLHTLTMHGNEVENCKGYRFRLVSSLPHLKSLDFSALTIVEKDKAKTWRRARRKKSGA